MNWFKKYGRNFPWRKDEIPPFITLLTELLLTQTRASDVIRIWHDFVTEYSTPQSIIDASEDELLLKLRTLGFGSIKVKALRLASTYILENYDGRVPDDLSLLLKIPHVGDYSARAVLCFAFGHRVEIVDTNVLRLFSRYFDLQFNRDARRAPQAWEIAKEILPRNREKAKPHNYGILDFTAEICKPGKPRCEICLLNRSCEYGKKQLKTPPVFKI